MKDTTLKEKRAGEDISCNQIAEKLNIARATYKRYEDTGIFPDYIYLKGRKLYPSVFTKTVKKPEPDITEDDTGIPDPIVYDYIVKYDIPKVMAYYRLSTSDLMRATGLSRYILDKCINRKQLPREVYTNLSRKYPQIFPAIEDTDKEQQIAE